MVRSNRQLLCLKTASEQSLLHVAVMEDSAQVSSRSGLGYETRSRWPVGPLTPACCSF